MAIRSSLFSFRPKQTLTSLLHNHYLSLGIGLNGGPETVNGVNSVFFKLRHYPEKRLPHTVIPA